MRYRYLLNFLWGFLMSGQSHERYDMAQQNVCKIQRHSMSPNPEEAVPADLSIISLSGALGERLRLSGVNKS